MLHHKEFLDITQSQNNSKLSNVEVLTPISMNHVEPLINEPQNESPKIATNKLPTIDDKTTTDAVRTNLTLALKKNFLTVEDNNGSSHDRIKSIQPSEDNPEGEINDQELSQSSTVSFFYIFVYFFIHLYLKSLIF